jgi:hypothetical protein
MKVTELIDLLPQNFSKWTKLAKQELSDNKN